MDFWTLAFKSRWVTADQLKGAVSTAATLKFGQITATDYKTITGQDYTTT